MLVAPVLRDAKRTMSALDIAIDVSGEPLVVALGEIFSIEHVLLKTRSGSAARYEDLLRRGFDRPFTGF